MNSHKERLRTISGKNTSLPRHQNRNSSRRSTSHLTDNEQKVYRLSSHSDDEVASKTNRNPVYMNVQQEHTQRDGSESPTYPEERKKRSTKSMDRLPTNSRQPTKSNGSKHHLSMHNPNTLNTTNIYKSQSLKALKASEPNHVLMKSSIQQEYRDKAIQRHFHGISHGKARKPCVIATVMFVLFGLCFIVGLVIIGLTYLYQNIMPSLDIGEGVGPGLVAGSFIFLGIGIKFIYDAHKMSRKERRTIGYKSYNQSYVGVRPNLHNPQKNNEKLVSGTASKGALTRVPNKIQAVHYDNQNTLMKSKTNLRTDKSSDV